ncbi:PrsW family glutamic-type intramembrane protease [Streptomyces griseoviridis]|uniref:RsiW-degrading membrane proteinase PrsW (M82 family) n=1 Tax=Streptomyces griseoviridis TaxID=45398 RepID=A0ABT9LNM0_STRGD|nr:PrsW family glutamic-type intramembrane protease [Streptomyces griseoviridis]MDP9685112.1 RsiW-degrading membrane proteinase PrsW (M82 family) [Streptomyces griseoviridis]GGT26675.1 protease PrsW [Streptomyces griseoviridis]
MSASSARNATHRADRSLAAAGRHWSWAAVLGVGLALFWLLRVALISTGNPNLVPSLIFLGAAVVPVTFVTFVAGRRLDFGVGPGIAAVTALVGGVLGVATAGVLEYRALLATHVLPVVVVGLIEEAAKLLMPLLVLLAVEDRHPADGLLVGVAAGAGFAVLETMGYAFVALVDSGGDLAAVSGLLVIRGVLSPAAHMAWTGLTSAALWSAATGARRGRGFVVFAGVFVVTVALHAAWDGFATTGAYVVLGAISLSLLVVSTHLLASARAARVPLAPVV